MSFIRPRFNKKPYLFINRVINNLELPVHSVHLVVIPTEEIIEMFFYPVIGKSFYKRICFVGSVF